MPNWDESSPELAANLTQAIRRLARQAQEREGPSLEMVREWHRITMAGLDGLDHPVMAGGFRGEPSLGYQVWVGEHEGVAPEAVGAELNAWVRRLGALLARLDERIPRGASPGSTDLLRAVTRVAAWAHGEWVRIHPFCNGNGRTARMIANYVFLRYGLPACVRLRPRPAETMYAAAGSAAMQPKDAYEPTFELFLRWLVARLDEPR
jgi:hypothetical protein